MPRRFPAPCTRQAVGVVQGPPRGRGWEGGQGGSAASGSCATQGAAGTSACPKGLTQTTRCQKAFNAAAPLRYTAGGGQLPQNASGRARGRTELSSRQSVSPYGWSTARLS